MSGSDAPSKNGGKTSNGRFAPGNPGGPGRPAGSRNRASLLLDEIADGEAEMLLRQVIERAKAGDAGMAKLVLDRAWPVRRGRVVDVSLPTISSAGDILDALATVVAALSDGRITPEEANALGGVIETHRRSIEVVELERRLRALEGARNAPA